MTRLSPTIQYQYDKAGNRTQLATTIGTIADFVTDYAYDNLHRMTGIQQHGVSGGNAVAAKRVDLSYDAAGQWQTIRRYEDLTATTLVAQTGFSFDNAGRLTDLSHSQPGGAGVLAGYEWTFDVAGRIDQFTSLVDGTVTYTYDDTDQLTGADYDYQTEESYAYDANGNRTTSGYTTGANNRLLSDGTYDYEYDAEGNRTRRVKIATGESSEYTWDHRNRLTKIVSKDSLGTVTQTVEYTYDVQNRRVAKLIGPGIGPAQIEHFVYDGERHERGNAGDDIVLRFENAQLANRYLHGPAVDQILADEQVHSLTSPGDVLWPLTDNLGTVRDLADFDPATGVTQIANHITYGAFGQITAETHAAVDHLFGFTGREIDEESDLYHYRARYYDPATGRFISQDPIGFDAGDGNLYRYAGNGSTTATDPSGWETKQQWQDRVLEKIGVTRGQLAQYDRFSAENRKIMRAIYGYYASLFAANSDLLWAGMAKMAGQTVWKACSDIQKYGALVSASAHATRLLNEIERQLFAMNLEIFEDLAWMHEAYVTKGLGEIERRFAAGEIDGATLEAWKMIDRGMVARGNTLLLRREQETILRRGYKELARLNVGKIMGALGTSPIPGGKPFCDVVPGGDLASFDDRWKWIEQDMLPLWLSMSDEERRRIVKVPLGGDVDAAAFDYFDLFKNIGRPSTPFPDLPKLPR